MILNEQKYNSRTRIWYHGSDYPTIQKKNWPCVFLTTDIKYAFVYTEELNIFICSLKAPLDIFNANSDLDQKKLVNKAEASGYELDREALGILARQDWLNYKKIYRSTLIDFIKDMGYDGFANFESDIPGSNASIGLFDESNVLIRKHLTKEELMKYRPGRDYIEARIAEAKQLVRYTAFYDAKHNYVANEDEVLGILIGKDLLKYMDNTDDIYDIYLSNLDEQEPERIKEFMKKAGRPFTPLWESERWIRVNCGRRC